MSITATIRRPAAEIDPSVLFVNSHFRIPRWRWERAKLLRAQPRYATIFAKENDVYIETAKEFQRKWDRCVDQFDKMRLRLQYPALYQAHELFTTEEQKYVRAELEARLLTQDSLEYIAKRVIMMPEAVYWYEHLFYNVTDRLNNRGYILHRAIGAQVHEGYTERDIALIWKVFAFGGGGWVIDLVMDRMGSGVLPTSHEGAKAYLHEAFRHILAVKNLISASTLPVNSHTGPLFMEVAAKYREIDANAGKSGGEGGVAENLKAMFKAIGWTIGESSIRVSPSDPTSIVGRLPSEIVVADSSAVELRSNEMLRLTAGQPLDREVLNMKFPEG